MDPQDVVRHLFRTVWNAHGPVDASGLVSPRFRLRGRGLPPEVKGPAFYADLARRTRQLFPDALFTIDDMVRDGDEVAVRWTMRATARRTGDRVTMMGLEIDRVEDGQLVETWALSDQSSFPP